MISTAIFSAILAVTAAQGFLPVEIPSTCASTLCLPGTTCKEVFDPVSAGGIVRGRCLESPAVTGNEGVCEDGQPLFVDLGQGRGVVEANCGSFKDSIICPSGYSCNDTHDVCCPSSGGVVDKPGDCPKPRQLDTAFGICASTCRVDSDCDGTDKCCGNACGATTCQAPVPSCSNTRCGPGEKCILQKVLCISEPCYPQPTCIPDKTLVKPGRCPVPRRDSVGICAFTCNSDSECEGNHKCCKNGCGGTSCQAPADPTILKPSCDTMKCGRGEKCVLEEVLCIRGPCDPQPTCVPDENQVKPGRCPVPRRDSVGICAFTCNSDSECEGNHKCCKNGCGGTSCQAPADPTILKPSCDTMKCGRGEICVLKEVYCFMGPCDPQPTCVPDESQVKPGRCPSVPFRQSRGRGRFCRSTCQTDANCKGVGKCCTNWCGAKSCQAPADLIAPTLSCANVRCRAGYECVMKPDPCFLPPCETNPVCVPIKKEKDGVCPSPRIPSFAVLVRLNCQRECRSDGDCSGIQKCCKNFPCGTSCQDPEPTCATMDCGQGYECVMQQVQCVRAPCPPTPICVRKEEPIKRCPFFPAWINPHCVRQDLCTNDRECELGDLCCSTDCGRRCLTPR